MPHHEIDEDYFKLGVFTARMVAIAVAASAGAQSKKYPPVGVDKDKSLAEQHSRLWDNHRLCIPSAARTRRSSTIGSAR